MADTRKYSTHVEILVKIEDQEPQSIANGTLVYDVQVDQENNLVADSFKKELAKVLKHVAKTIKNQTESE